MSAAGSNTNATITINGNAAGAVNAATSVGESLSALNARFAGTEDATATLSDAMQRFIASLSDAMGMGADAASALGDLSAAQTADAATALDASTATDAYAASVSATVDAMMAQSAQMSENVGMLGSMSERTGETTASMSDLTGGMFDFLGPLGQSIDQAQNFVTAMAEWSVLQDVIGWVQDLSSELFNLQEQTERNTYSWQYLFAGANGPSLSNAQGLAQWSSQFSQNIPFTRQDLMQGITTLGTAQLNPQQVEQFMPFLADLTATLGAAHGTDLSTASQAIFGAMNGYSRMLKYDLGINPEELLNYGLQATGSGMGLHITDPNSLLVALERYAVAKHISNLGANGQDINGAAQSTVQNTWWGAYSSATDQLQNFLLQVGGTNLNGQIRQGSFFGELKDDLFSLLDWFSSHQTQITQFADTLSQIIGTVVQGGGGLLSQFFTWLGQIGTYSDVMNLMTETGATLQNIFGLNQPTAAPAFAAGTATSARIAAPVPGGAGGRTTPSVTSNARSAQPTGVEAIPGVEGIMSWFSQAMGNAGVTFAPVQRGLQEVGQAFQQLGKAWQDAGGDQLTNSIGHLLQAIFGTQATSDTQGLGALLTNIAGGITAMAATIEQHKQTIKNLTDFINNLATALQNLDQWINSINWSKFGDEISGVWSGLSKAPSWLQPATFGTTGWGW